MPVLSRMLLGSYPDTTDSPESSRLALITALGVPASGSEGLNSTTSSFGYREVYNLSHSLPQNSSSAYDISKDSFVEEMAEEAYIFHKPEVKIPLLILYSIVFVLAFFGNLLVVLVMTLHRRMRNHTNFFLTNLAVADLCVAVFCIYQNFAMYVIQDWYLGQFLCQMYHFITSLSCTASVIILVVVSAERYLAIVEPLKTKSVLTRKNMVVTMVLVWVFSALYSCPRLFYFEVAEYPVEGGTEAMCILRRDHFDTKTWDVVSLVLLFLLPLLLLTLLYIKIAQVLCASSKLLSQDSYGDEGKSCKISNRSSISDTVKGCPCSTKQECLTTMTAINIRTTVQSKKVNECAESLYSPSALNCFEQKEIQHTKRCYLKSIFPQKKWSNTKMLNISYGKNGKDVNICGNDDCRNCSNKMQCATSETCLHKILLQENSQSYTSLSDPANSNHKRVDKECNDTKLYLPSFLDNNDTNLEVLPMCANTSSRSLQLANIQETVIDDELFMSSSLQNIPSPSITSRCARTNDYDTLDAPRRRPTDKQSFHDQSLELVRDQNSINRSREMNFYTCTKKDARRAIVMRPSPVVIKARKKVVHMLVLVVISFAVFSFPFHTRKMMQYFLPEYDHTSEFSIVLTPITCLVMFAHSAVNPILYTCLSRKFRTSLRDLVTCKMSRRSSTTTATAVNKSRPLLARLKAESKVSVQLN